MPLRPLHFRLNPARPLQLAPAALISLLALLGGGCDGDKAAGIAAIESPAATVAGAHGENTLHGVVLVDVVDGSGVDFMYRNGAEANQAAIIQSLGGGVGAVDFDGDRRTDLFFPGGGTFVDGPNPEGAPAALYRNLGNWKFANVSAESGVVPTRYYTHGCAAGDINNDGFIDLLVTGFGGLQLLVNQGDGTFVEGAGPAGLDDSSWSSSAGWADFNGDGYLDVYVAHYVDWSPFNHRTCPSPEPGVREICAPKVFQPLPHCMYYGNGDGTFRDVTAEVGLRPDGKGLGVIIGDVDADNDADIYVANDTTINFLYLNQLSDSGRAVFEEVGEIRGVHTDDNGTPTGSMGTDIGDFNGDLAPDLWCANYEREPFGLYQNDSRGSFLHVSQNVGITVLGGLFVGFGTSFADIDRDGDEDLLVACGHVVLFPTESPLKQLPLLLLNQDRKLYERAMFAGECYFNAGHMGRGLATADFDADGDLDLVIVNTNEPVGLIDNQTKTPDGYLRVRLVGRASSRDAVGARLVLTTTAGSQLRLVKGGSSYLSHSDLSSFFGVPNGSRIEKLSIVWPSGQTQELTDLDVGEELIAIEPAH